MDRSDHTIEALLERHTDMWNRHDLDGLMSLFAEDCVFDASGGPDAFGTRFRGAEEVRAAFAGVFAAMPDARWGEGVHHRISASYGVSEWILTGTLSDGRRLEVHGCDFITMREGKIAVKNSYRKQRPPQG